MLLEVCVSLRRVDALSAAERPVIRVAAPDVRLH